MRPLRTMKVTKSIGAVQTATAKSKAKRRFRWRSALVDQAMAKTQTAQTTGGLSKSEAR